MLSSNSRHGACSSVYKSKPSAKKPGMLVQNGSGFQWVSAESILMLFTHDLDSDGRDSLLLAVDEWETKVCAT